MDLSRLDDVLRPSAFAEPAAMDHAAIYADIVVQLLADGGVEMINMGAVARAMKQVPSAVHHRAGGRNRFLRMVLIRFSDRWLAWSCRPDPDRRLVRLPESDDEVHGLRVWSALGELAAGEARAGRRDLAELVAMKRAEHRAFLEYELRAVLGRAPSPLEVLVVEQVGIALQAAVTAPVEPLSPGIAAEIIAWLTEQLRRSH